MLHKIAAATIWLAAAILGGAGIFAVGAGLLDLDNPWVMLAFWFGGLGIIGGLVLALIGRGLWRDRVWAWVLAAGLGVVTFVASLGLALPLGDGVPVFVVIVLPMVVGAVLIGLTALRLGQWRTHAASGSRPNP